MKALILELTKLLRSEESVTELVEFLNKFNFHYDTENTQATRSCVNVEYDFIVSEGIRNEKEVEDIFNSLPDRTPVDQ